jgi:hypothetical protein
MKKRAYIYPIFWFMVERLYRMDDVKIILIWCNFVIIILFITWQSLQSFYYIT